MPDKTAGIRAGFALLGWFVLFLSVRCRRGGGGSRISRGRFALRCRVLTSPGPTMRQFGKKAAQVPHTGRRIVLNRNNCRTANLG